MLRGRRRLLAALATLTLVLIAAASSVYAGGTLPQSKDNSGAASYSVPLELPPGPAESSPDLALVYSSAGGSGPVGYGWSLPYSSIHLDQRWGVPTWWLPDSGYDCDSSAWAGRLWLDSMETVPWDEDPLWGKGRRCIYRTRPDSFVAIVPVWRNGPPLPGPIVDLDDQPIGWAVVKPDGTIWWYGDDPRRGYDSVETTYRRITPGTDEQPPVVVEWLLHHVQDRDGNLVTYWPDRVEPSWSTAVGTPYGTDGEACDGCLRAITWASSVKKGSGPAGSGLPGTDHAYQPIGDSISGFEPQCNGSPCVYAGGAIAQAFDQFLTDPGGSWPAIQTDHFYAVRIDWEDRPDFRVSFADGNEHVVDRRVFQIAVGTGMHPRHEATSSGIRTVFHGTPDWIRTWRLDYDEGTTARSRLTRVWPLPGQYSTTGSYTEVPEPGEPWEAGDSTYPLNPWEFVYSDSTTLDPDGPAMPPAFGEMPSELSWLGTRWCEGSFPPVTLQDLNGDRLPDLVQHTDLLVPCPVLEASGTHVLNPFADALIGYDSPGFSNWSEAERTRLYVRWNQGSQFSDAQDGPVDPFALQKVADYQIGLDCDDDGDLDPIWECLDAAVAAAEEQEDDATVTRGSTAERGSEGPATGTIEASPWDFGRLRERRPDDEGKHGADSGVLSQGLEPTIEARDDPRRDRDDLDSKGTDDSDEELEVTGLDGCAAWYSGFASLTAQIAHMPMLTPGTPAAMSAILPEPLGSAMAWCEHRSCSPYCELGTSVSWAPASDLLVSDPDEPGMEALGLALDALETAVGATPPYSSIGALNDLVLETTQAARSDGTGLHDNDDLTLWHRYGVARGSTGSALGSVSDFGGWDYLLGGIEPGSRVRWVDGYAQNSFQTRIHDTNVELGRQEPSDDGIIVVEEGTVHDFIDINGDGYPDRVLGGAGILENHLLGESAVLNVDPLASRGEVASTEAMTWMVALWMPSEGRFGELEAWPMPITHELMMGEPTLLPADEPANDPRLFHEHHHYSFLAVHEGTFEAARSPVSAGASAGVGFNGPSLGSALTLGPLSLSLGMTASGPSPSIGLGPVSFSTTGLSLGPVTLSPNGKVSAGAANIIFFIIGKALQAFDVPYSLGASPSVAPDGGGPDLMVSLPGAGSDCLLNCRPTVRWQRQGLHDMNGDGRPDYVVAANESNDKWDTAGVDWLVLFNNGYGFDEPVLWPGAATDYLSANITEAYMFEDPEGCDRELNGELGQRRSHQMAGLVDVNGDGLPDFVYSGQGEGVPQPPQVAYTAEDGHAWSDWTSTLDSVERNREQIGIFVMLNNGHGFESPISWFEGGAPDEAFVPEGHFPALSSSRTRISQSSLYNDSASFEINGIRDWNGDGLADFYAMNPADDVPEGYVTNSIPSLIDACDSDDDGLPDFMESLDTNGDCIWDFVEPQPFGDMIEQLSDLSESWTGEPADLAELLGVGANGAPIWLEGLGVDEQFPGPGFGDLDGDGLPDYLDDADGDGVPDGIGAWSPFGDMLSTAILAADCQSTFPTQEELLFTLLEEREPVVFLSDGRRFSTDELSESDRAGRFVLDTSSMMFVQKPPGLWTGPGIGHPHPQVDVDVKWEQPGGPITQSMFADLDGNGTLDWVQGIDCPTAIGDEAPPWACGSTPDFKGFRLYKLQSEVPDQLERIFEPSGAIHSLTYQPARVFMDLPGSLDSNPLSDGVDDAFPASSQVLTSWTTRDGLGALGASPLTVTFEYADPVWSPWVRRAFGFGLVRDDAGIRQRTTEYFTDLRRAGLAHRVSVEDDAGQLWRQSDTTWSYAEFDDNYPRITSLLSLRRNWHYAPIEVHTTTWEHSLLPIGGGWAPSHPVASSVEQTTWTRYEPLNGMADCTQEDLDGDGMIDRIDAAWYDGVLLARGVLTAVEKEATYLPSSAVPGPEPRCLPRLAQRQRLTEYDYFPSGRVKTRTMSDSTGLSTSGPAVLEFDYYPNGQELSRHDPAAQASWWSLYDPQIGVYGTRTYEPATELSSSSPVEHPATATVCGISSAASCPGAAHGQVASTVDRKGLQTEFEYDDLGRPWKVWDSLALSITGPAETITTYERYSRLTELTDPLASQEGLPATATVLTPVNRPDEPVQQVETTTFLDGLGRTLLVVEEWIDQAGVAGQKLSGWTEYDDWGRTAAARWPCFTPNDSSSPTWTNQQDWVSAGGFQPDLHCHSSPIHELPAIETWTWDVMDRELTHVRPDLTQVDTWYYLSSLVRGPATYRVLLDDFGELQRLEEATGPFDKGTLRFDAQTWFRKPQTGYLPGDLQQDTDTLETWESFDALGRRISVWRTGQLPAQQTRFVWDGLDRLVEYDDPDQGEWRFDHDASGRLTRRELIHPVFLGSPVSWTTWEHDEQGRVNTERHKPTPATPSGEEWWDWTWDVPVASMMSAADPTSLLPTTGLLGSRGLPTTATHHLAASSGPDIVRSWLHDRRGRLVEEQQSVDDPAIWPDNPQASMFVQYAYAVHGTRTDVRMPVSGELLSTTLDSLGRPFALAGESPWVEGATYEVMGRPVALQLGNGAVQEFAYDTGVESNGALVWTQVRHPDSGTVYLDRTYQWDGMGNLRRWTDWPAGPEPTETFDCDYDGLGALLGCKLGEHPESGFQYRYDVLGNILQEDVDLPGATAYARKGDQYYRGAGSLLPLWMAASPLNAPVARVEIDSTTGSVLSQSLRYDPRGHLVQQSYHAALPTGSSYVTVGGFRIGAGSGLALPGVDAERHFTWNAMGRLEAVEVACGGSGLQEVSRYWYDESGQRVGKKVQPPAFASGAPCASTELDPGASVRRFPGLAEVTVRDGELHLTSYYALSGKLVGQRDSEVGGLDPEDALRFLSGDHLGSTSIVLGPEVAGSPPELIQRVDYEPFGRIRRETGAQAGVEDFEVGAADLLYNGKKRDRTAYGLQDTPWWLEGYDYGARIYLPQLGRWASADQITPDFVWVANAFAYVANNPLKYVDPTGQAPVRRCEGRRCVGTIDEFVELSSMRGVSQSLDRTYDHWAGPLVSNNVPADRNFFIWTRNFGWIDMKHFIKAAYMVTEGNGLRLTLKLGEQVEARMQRDHRNSHFSFEDLPSNLQGALFGERLKGRADIDLEAELRAFFEELEAGAPEDAPNWAEVPKTAGDVHEPAQVFDYVPLHAPGYWEYVEDGGTTYEDIMRDTEPPPRPTAIPPWIEFGW